MFSAGPSFLLLLLGHHVLDESSLVEGYGTAFVPRKFASSFAPKAAAAAERGTTKRRRRSQQRQHSNWRRTTTTATTRNTKLSMLVETSGGMEELQELTEQADASAGILGRRLRTSPGFWKFCGYAAVPVTAAAGFLGVPSRRFVAHAAGAAIAGVAGAVGKSRLDCLVADRGAGPAIAQAVVDAGLEDPAAVKETVLSVRGDFGLEDEDFEAECCDIYAAYLTGMVKYNPKPKTSELKELQSLKEALSLDNLQVGQAHADAAAAWYRSVSLFTPEEELRDDPDHPERAAMDKLLFLTERALRQGGETEEAFKFEMTRVAAAFKLSLDVALERVAETANPFYLRALKSTRAKLGTGQVSAVMLERARHTLGISEQTAADLHVQCFHEQVREELGLPPVANKEDDDDDDDDDDEDSDSAVDYSKLKFADGARDKLNQLRDILGLSETDAYYEVTAEATPLYQKTALAALKDVLAGTKTPERAWEIMDARREELLLPEESSKELVSSMVMQALGGPLEETNKFAEVNNEAATYDHLLEALEAKRTIVSILRMSGWDEYEKFDKTFCNPWDRQSANGFLGTDERLKMYSIFLNRSLLKADGGKLSDGQYDDVQQVKGLLGITDQQVEREQRKTFGPEVQKVLQTAAEEIVQDYTPELVDNMRERVNEVMEGNRLSTDFLRELGAGYYDKAVRSVSETSPGGVPTTNSSQALAALRDLFSLNDDEAEPAHAEHFGPVYKKSVLEAMGSTGVIRPEFRQPLEDLRGRLGVSEDRCRTLFLEAVEEKMKPMAEWIGSEMERTMLTQKQLSERRKRDVGEDMFQTGKGATGVLGLGAEVNIMGDIMNLIDFYKENDIAKEEKVGTKRVEKQQSEEGQEEAVIEEVPVYETVYPVTALGCDAVDQEMAELLYRQFVVGAFTAQGEQADRYEGNREYWAGILGLSKEKVAEINDTIGGTVYDNFISNAMKTKPAGMDQQDMMFLANIQGKLGLTNEQGEKLLLQSQKKVLSEEIEALMDAPTPESIKAFREKCNTMGMDLQEDVGVSKQRLGRMFDSEIIPGLKSGEINPESFDVLTEIQESLGLEAEDGETMFENVLIRLSKSAMDLISSELLRGRDENTVPLITELVQYAAFTGGDLGLEVEEAVGNKVLSIYEAFDFSGLTEEQVKTNKEYLRTAMGLT